ncbi:unnamed protein product [Polarella glacialis]|uniref:J domain-containing protein n=1 Tax=Polarella glacialis TaxID=89957 RepID=A0A813LCV0_POLGL|nr:unnamed protein product [Polarella glacialis]
MRAIVELLLEHRADPNVRVAPIGNGALQLTASAGKVESYSGRWAQLRVLELLLGAGADANQLDESGEGPLTEAVLAGDMKVCELLVSCGASILITQGVKGQSIFGLAPDSILRDFLQNLAVQQAHRRDKLVWAGEANRKLHGYGKAKACFADALRLDPVHARALLGLADACWMLGEVQVTYETAAKVMKLDAKSLRARELCAQALRLLDRLEEALEACSEDDLDLDPDLDPHSIAEEQQQSFMTTKRLLLEQASQVLHIDGVMADEARMMDAEATDDCLQGVQGLIQTLNDLESKSLWGRRLRFTKVKILLHPVPGKLGLSEEFWKRRASAALLDACHLLELNPLSHSAVYWHARCTLRTRGRREVCSLLEQQQQQQQRQQQQQQQQQQALGSSMGPDGGDSQIKQLLGLLVQAEQQKQLGNLAFSQMHWQAAVQHYDSAEQLDVNRFDAQFAALLLCNRGWAKHKLGQTIEALEDVMQAIAITTEYAKAYFRRGLIYMDLENFQKALADFDAVAAIAPEFQSLEDWRARATRWIVQPPVHNYYAILGASAKSNAAAIKKAYRVTALRWHPDKNAGNEELAERSFKLVNEAFEALSDPDRRRKYDHCDADRKPFCPEDPGGRFKADLVCPGPADCTSPSGS